MGENSKISWCDHTHNRWMGCTKVSAGCKNCYAETFVTKRMGLPVWGDKAERKPISQTTIRQLAAWNRKARDMGQRHRVFCSSLADVFEDREDVRILRAGLFRDIKLFTSLDFLLLTKRPENMVRLAEEAGWDGDWPSNAWAGCTVESQAMAEQRIPHLLRVPARVRFLSCEPLLEAVDLTSHLAADVLHDAGLVPSRMEIDWIITGGESGPGARPFDLGWARFLRDQCKAAGVPFFFKQTGAKPFESRPAMGGVQGTDEALRHLGTPHLQADWFKGWTLVSTPDGVSSWYRYPKFKDKAGADPDEWPEDLRVQEFPT